MLSCVFYCDPRVATGIDACLDASTPFNKGVFTL